MHKLVVLYPPPADPGHFEKHYRNVHLPLAARLPGVLAARFSLTIDSGDSQPPYFAVFEADFADVQSLQSAMASEWGQKVTADVPNYASAGAVVLNYEVEPLPLSAGVEA